VCDLTPGVYRSPQIFGAVGHLLNDAASFDCHGKSVGRVTLNSTALLHQIVTHLLLLCLRAALALLRSLDFLGFTGSLARRLRAGFIHRSGPGIVSDTIADVVTVL
jgi:hypothetical protein